MAQETTTPPSPVVTPARASFVAPGALALVAQARRAANVAGKERLLAEVIPFARDFERELEVQLADFRRFRELLEVCPFSPL